MQIGEPPADPFAGMSPEERKRAQETAILEMVYDLSRFHTVVPDERPDFRLKLWEGYAPFGVEITQLFASESIARLNLVHGYHHRLWSGGSHLHKADRMVLHSVRVEITDQDGNVKQTEVPAIFTQVEATVETFRSALREVILAKGDKGYDGAGELRHINLVILDWFELPFDASDYCSDRFLDDDLRAALRACPFREVFLLLADTVNGENPESGDDARADELVHPYLRVIPLQQLLIMERVYVTGHVIDQAYRHEIQDLAHLNRLVIDHVSRVQGYGEPVECDGRIFLRYRATLLEIAAAGMQVRDLQDYRSDPYPTVEVTDRMDPGAEARVTELAATNVFGSGYTLPANKPSTWPLV